MVIKCKLKVIFAERNITQAKFAKEIDISETTLSLLVKERGLPSLEVAYKISRGLNLPVEKIWVVEGKK